jgi:hypothetical protein
MPRSLTRLQVEELTRSVELVLRRIQSRELTARPEMIYRLEGALVALRAVLGSSEDLIGELFDAQP